MKEYVRRFIHYQDMQGMVTSKGNTVSYVTAKGEVLKVIKARSSPRVEHHVKHLIKQYNS